MPNNKLPDLEDFNDPQPNKREEKVDIASHSEDVFEENIVFLEKKHHLTEEELEEIKKESYNNGVKETEIRLENSLKKHYDEIIETIPKEISICDNKFRDKLNEILNLFFDFFNEFVEQILELPEEELRGIKNNILQELIEFIKESEEEIVIKCCADDKKILEASLDKHENVRFELCKDDIKGQFKVVSQNSIFILSSDEWKKRVFQKIRDSVFSLVAQRRGELQKDDMMGEGDDK